MQQLEASRKQVPGRQSRPELCRFAGQHVSVGFGVLGYGFHRTWNALLVKGDISSEKKSFGMQETHQNHGIRLDLQQGKSATTRVPKKSIHHPDRIKIHLKPPEAQAVCRFEMGLQSWLFYLTFGVWSGQYSHIILCWGYSRSPAPFPSWI